jgi:predicted lipid carrier protein YhbT
MDKPIKIETVTKQTFRSKSTDKTYDTKEEFLRNHKEEDLAVDTAVTVTNKGLDLLQKVMQNAKSKS